MNLGRVAMLGAGMVFAVGTAGAAQSDFFLPAQLTSDKSRLVLDLEPQATKGTTSVQAWSVLP